MLASMLLLFGIALWELGGFAELWAGLEAIDPSLTNPVPADLRFGFLLYVLGWMGAGFGVVGQPHIMVRAMAIRESEQLKTARHIYFAWYVVFTATKSLPRITSGRTGFIRWQSCGPSTIRFRWLLPWAISA